MTNGRSRTRRALPALAGVVALAAGCAPGPAPTPTPASTVTPVRASPISSPTAPPTSALAAIGDDLQGRGVSPEGMAVLRADAVTWPDGSLGCPELGIVYPATPEDGLQIVVEAAGRTWDYRFDSAGRARLCQPRP